MPGVCVVKSKSERFQSFDECLMFWACPSFAVLMSPKDGSKPAAGNSLPNRKTGSGFPLYLLFFLPNPCYSKVWMNCISYQASGNRSKKTKGCRSYPSRKPADHCTDTTFNPTIEAINVVIKKRRQKSAGSLKKMIPTSTVPTAPMPVHTA